MEAVKVHIEGIPQKVGQEDLNSRKGENKESSNTSPGEPASN